jgi:hypothetical protein
MVARAFPIDFGESGATLQGAFRVLDRTLSLGVVSDSTGISPTQLPGDRLLARVDGTLGWSIHPESLINSDMPTYPKRPAKDHATADCSAVGASDTALRLLGSNLPHAGLGLVSVLPTIRPQLRTTPFPVLPTIRESVDSDVRDTTLTIFQEETSVNDACTGNCTYRVSDSSIRRRDSSVEHLRRTPPFRMAG